MKLLKTIKERDVNPNAGVDARIKYSLRRAARAVVFDKDNKVALLRVNKYSYHKLPGGGIKDGEEIIQGLKRECLEEIGCEISLEGEVGMVVEYRDEWNLKQESYCYLAKVEGKKREPSFTQKEKDQGFEALWLDLDEAIRIMEDDKPLNYEGKFIKIRDMVFLKEARKLKDIV